MKHLKLFEAFASKNISAIEKFLDLLDNNDRNEFIDFLKSISRRRDIPLSNFKGEYVKSLTAIKMNIEGQELIKFWFSVEEGFIGATLTKRYAGNLEHTWMQGNFIKNFITNNVATDDCLRESSWTNDFCERVLDSQFALVINLTELSKGLRDLKDKRKENKKGALKLSSDEFIRLDNDRRRKDILRKRRGVSRDDVLDFMMMLVKKFRCYDPMDLIDCTFELYYRNKVDREMLDAVMDELKERYGDRLSGYRDGFGSGFGSRRFGRPSRYGYGDPWGDNSRGNYGYDDPW
jgi:hypothetical protein